MTQVLEQLSGDLKDLLKQVKAQEKTVSLLLRSSRESDGPQLLAGLASLDNAVLNRFDLRETVEEAVAGVREQLNELRQQKKRALMHDLSTACQESGRPFKRIGDSPPELLLAPFTVTLDLNRLEAVISFARQELATVPAETSIILDTLKSEEKALQKRQPSPERFIEQLFWSYHAVCARDEKPSGERVDIAEVLPFVALFQQSPAFTNNPVRERFNSFSRAHFLLALSILRTTRTFEHNGHRLDLGTATGNSTRNKNRVFFLPDTSGSGQLYLSLRFVRLKQGGGQ